MGEEIDEVHQAFHDLHETTCDLVTITQYLRPKPLHYPTDTLGGPASTPFIASPTCGLEP